MSTTYMIGSMMLAIPLLLFFWFMIYIAVKEAPWASLIFVYILVMVVLLATGCTQESAADPITDLNAAVKELDKEIIEVLPEVEEVVKGCVVREDNDGGLERTLVLCRI